jgi:hypothetical protein
MNAPPAKAGRRWPGRTITYFDGVPGYDRELAAAVGAWNRTGLVRLRKTSRSRAQVKILRVPKRFRYGSSYGVVGFVPRNVLVPFPYPMKSVRGSWILFNPSPGADFFNIRVFAHELGHVIALGHTNRACATMSYKWDECPKHPTQGWQQYCRVLEPFDIGWTRRLYGGRGRVSDKRYCPLPLPKPVTALVGSVNLSSDPSYPHEVEVSWKFVRGDIAATSLVTRAYGGAACDMDSSNATLAYNRTSDEAPAAGRACYTIWTRDKWKRLSRPRSVFVEVPAQPLVVEDPYEDPYEEF